MWSRGFLIDQDNLIQVPTSLHGNDLAVNYSENEQGDIDRVWILRREAANGTLPQ